MAYFRKTLSGEYQAVIRLKSINKSKVFKLKSDAVRWATETESEIERGVFVDKTKAENTLLREVCERYCLDVLPKLKGAKSDQSRINVLCDLIGNTQLTQINGVFLAKLRDQLLNTYSPQTVIHYLNLVSRLFKFALNELGLPITMPYIKKPATPKGREQRVTDDEIDALIKASESPALKVIIILAVETAMRRAEMTNLKWTDINYPLVTLYDTKNGERRTVPLSKKAVELLRAMPRSIDGKVFGIRADSATQAFERARKRCDLKHIRLHDLRHEAVSRLSKRVPNVIELAAISGHKDLQTLKRYYHTDPLELAKKIG